jgi:CheY-like chemotaxis protein
VKRLERLNILVVDDQRNVLDVLKDVLGRKLGHRVVCARMAGEALRLVSDRLFDIVLVDAKMPYKDAGLGGLLVSDEIRSVLGIGSIILMSQYSVRERVAGFNPDYAFLPKPESGTELVEWAQRDLMEQVGEMISAQYGFVVMPYGREECDAWYLQKLTPWVREAGFQLRRMDEISSGNKAINVDLLRRIRDAHFVVVYAPERNANVFFEAGYAFAWEKQVLVFTDSVESLPFDIRSNRAFPVNGDDKQERRDILKFMLGLRQGLSEG